MQGWSINGTESSLGTSVTVPGLTPAAGTFMWLRAQVTGTNPTTIKVRAWRDGDPEPSTWQFTATNSLAALQAAGGVGLASYIGSGTTNVPVTVSFDDFVAVDPNGATLVAPTSSFTFAQADRTASSSTSRTDQQDRRPPGHGTSATARHRPRAIPARPTQRRGHTR